MIIITIQLIVIPITTFCIKIGKQAEMLICLFSLCILFICNMFLDKEGYHFVS